MQVYRCGIVQANRKGTLMAAKFNPQKIIDALFADDWLAPWQLH